uniref:Secreted protein n=1 Tax=Octopus bimaculoides TaxID=37653 RepID=A0A0L8IG65_OCTBM
MFKFFNLSLHVGIWLAGRIATTMPGKSTRLLRLECCFSVTHTDATIKSFDCYCCVCFYNSLYSS